MAFFPLESPLDCRSAFFRPLHICAAVDVAYFDVHGQAFAPNFHDEFVTRVNTQRYESIRLERTSPEAGGRGVALYHPDPVQRSCAISACWLVLSLYA